MKKNKWSDYDKYIVLSDKSNCQLGGTYVSFLNFKKVLEIIRNISSSDKNSYLYDGNIYNRKITSADAKKIILDVSECRWSTSIIAIGWR